MPKESWSPDQVLVITTEKSFWDSEESRGFPHRVHTRIFGGKSWNLRSSLWLAVRALLAVWRQRPKVIFFGSAPRIVPWFIILKRLGLLGGARLVSQNQVHFSDRAAAHMDRIIVYSSDDLNLHHPDIRHKYVRLPLPADGDFDELRPQAGEYVFAGGGAGRDFASLIDAFAELPQSLVIVTFTPEHLGHQGPLPANVEVRWRMPLDHFLALMSEARLVVVPLLRQPGNPHGHTTVVQALRMGKAVVSTSGCGVDDYVHDGVNGLLVEPGDVAGYRHAVSRVYDDDGLRRKLERQAAQDAGRLTYAEYDRGLRSVLAAVLAGEAA